MTDNMTDSIDEHLLAIIAQVELLRDERKVGPAEVVPWMYLQEEIKSSIMRLTKSGKLHKGNTINDRYVKIIR